MIRREIDQTLPRCNNPRHDGERSGSDRVKRNGRGRHAVGAVRMLVAGAMMAGLAGCITVNAPDKPIIIELNINIKQEVIYRLSADAGKTIDSNKDIF